MDFIKSKIKWFFTDPKTGKIVIAEKANAPLIFAVSAFILSLIFDGDLHKFFQVMTRVGFLWWAGWEIFDGDCPWRRFLGLSVSAFIAYQMMMMA